VLKDGRRFGSLNVRSINATAVDRLYEKLRVKDGVSRDRSALLSMTVCKLAWDVAHRVHPALVPATNPFKGVEVEYEPKQNRAATIEQLMHFVRGSDEDGTPSLGTAAMIAFYWLVRASVNSESAPSVWPPCRKLVNVMSSGRSTARQMRRTSTCT
jgi:hypothetical protein